LLIPGLHQQFLLVALVLSVQQVLFLHDELVDAASSDVFLHFNMFVALLFALILFHLSSDALVCEQSFGSLQVLNHVRIGVFRTKVRLHEHPSIYNIILDAFNVITNLALQSGTKLLPLLLPSNFFIVNLVVHHGNF